MTESDKKILWKAIRCVIEFILGFTTVYLAIQFFSSTSKEELSTNMAISAFLFIIIVILYFFINGFYNLITIFDHVRDKIQLLLMRGRKSVRWDKIGGILIGVLLFVAGLSILTSGVLDIYHFFNCTEFVHSSYIKSAILSVASVSGLTLGIAMTIMGAYCLSKGGNL